MAAGGVIAGGRNCRSISNGNAETQRGQQHPPPGVNRPSGIRVITQTDRINLSALAGNGEEQGQKDLEPALGINQSYMEMVW